MKGALLKLEGIFENIEENRIMAPKEIFSSLFQETTIQSYNEDYPDIFKLLFLELCEKATENSTTLKLFLIVICKATIKEKMQQLKVLICAPE